MDGSCFACLLVTDTKFLKIVYDDIEVETKILTQVKYALPELEILNPENTMYICHSCYTNLQCFNKFKKKCLENYIILNDQYLQKNQGTNDIQILKKQDTDIHVNVEKNKDKLLPSAKQNILKTEVKNTTDTKKNVDAELNLKKEIEDALLVLAEQDDLKTILHHSIDIKDESQELDQQLVQYKLASDDEQDGDSSVTSEINNETNSTTGTDSEELECLICKAVFTEKNKLYEHVYIHINNIRGAKCPICKKLLSSSCSLRRHLKLHFGIKEFKCTICQKEFIGKYVLDGHMKTHSNKISEVKKPEIIEFKCLMCDEVFLDKLEYSTHAIDHINHTKGKMCPICNDNRAKNCFLQLHMYAHFGLKKFECNICKLQYNSKNSLDLHMMKHEPRKCHSCSKMFTDKKSLYEHMKMHKRVKKPRPPKEYKCTLCLKKFTTPYGLKIHMKIHLGIKDFICSVCGKMFRDKSGLQLHMFVHDPTVDLKLLV